MKLLMLSLSMLVVPLLAELTVVTQSDTFLNIQYYFFMVVLCVPEISFIVSKRFRTWLVNGIENSDGKFESNDLNGLVSHWLASWCIRLFVLFGLRETFFNVQIRDIWIYATLAGASGTEFIGFLIRSKTGSSVNKDNK